MKYLKLYLLSCGIGIFFLSCNTQTPVEKGVKKTTHTFSESYKAPVFKNDDRKKKIRSVEAEIHNLMVKHAKEKNIPGIAYGIVVDNELILSSAIGFMDVEKKIKPTPQSSFRIASMTKSFTAMAILKLRDEGKLSLCDPVSKYIPEMGKLQYLTKDSPVIDIENLLTMTAGFPEDNPWGDRQLDENSEMLIGLVDEGISFANVPAYDFEYSNTGFALLGNIVSRVSGMPFQKYITQNILKPLGMNHTYWEYDNVPKDQLVKGYRWENGQWKLEPMLHDGAYGAMGGLITSIEDFSKYVSFHLSAWPPRNDDETGPVKRSSLREMQTPQFSRLYAKATDFNGDPCAVMSGYGFGLGISEDCRNFKQIGHGGALPGFGSNYKFFPEYGVGIMAFCNLTYTAPWPYKEIGKLLFENLDFKPRQLPVSDILKERQAQIVQLIQNWNKEMENKILAENFFLDKSREDRIKEVENLLTKAGPIETVEKIYPVNQLRGSFKIKTENGFINIFYTLTPEKDPKVQQLDISFKPDEGK